MHGMVNHLNKTQNTMVQQEDKPRTGDSINHPKHYGGVDNPYEAIKVIEAWDLNFNVGNVLKYIARAGKKDGILEAYKKAAWYMNREVQRLENLK